MTTTPEAPRIKFDYFKQRDAFLQRNQKSLGFSTQKQKLNKGPVDPSKALIINRKSAEPRLEQIKRQIQQFTKNQNVGRSDLVSMDQLTDLKEVVQEYG